MLAKNQTSSSPKLRSALPPARDTLMVVTDFRVWLDSEVQSPEIEVCFTPKTRHSAAYAGLLELTQSDHGGFDLITCTKRVLELCRIGSVGG